MKCPSCDLELPAAGSACPRCAPEVPGACPACGSPLPPRAKFCPECGARAAEPPAVTAVVEPEVPFELRQKIEAVRAELSGERRQVTVLFADLSGFTKLSESLDPEDVTFLVNRILRELSEAVYRYEGYVDKYIGDAVMALFGAPLAHEDDPERAVLSALAMMDVLERYNATAEEPLELHVGVNLGEVVAAHVGSELRMQYTVVGDTVNVAARLQDAAGPNTILVSESVRRRLSGRVRVQATDPLTLKGKAEKVFAYRVVGFEEAVRSPSADATPFVGREAEVGALAAFLDRIDRSRGGALLLEGEPGAGKSRLVREALSRSAVDLQVYEVGFSPVRLPGEKPPLTRLFHQVLPDHPSGADAASRALALLGAAGAQHRDAIEELAREPDGTATARSQVDPSAARQNRWAAVVALLHATSRERPVLVVLEDTHWMDDGTREFVHVLAGSVVGDRMGILLTSRLAAEPSWAPHGCERLALAPLPPAAAEELAGRLLAEDLREEQRQLLRRAQGNPLFLEELARNLLESAGRRAAGVVPDTLQGLLVSRIDRLDDAVRRLLQMAAVLGAHFPTRLLERMYRIEPQPLPFDAALRRLEEGRFLTPELNGEVRHRFHHALVQETAYAGLLVRIRKVLHETAARLGEEHFADRLEAEAPFFAHHYWEAGLTARAGPHLWSAGREAARRYELAAAESFLERAAGVLEGGRDWDLEADERAAFHEIFGNVLFGRGRLDDAEAQFLRLEELSQAAGHRTWRTTSLEARGRLEVYRGRLKEAQAFFTRALEEADEPEGRLAANLHNNLGVVAYYRQDPDEAFARHERARELRERVGDELGLAKTHINLGNLRLAFREDPEGAERSYRRALELARRVGDRQLTSGAIKNLGGVAVDRGEWHDAMQLFAQARAIQEEIGWHFLGYLTLQNQIVCETVLGRLADALRHIEMCETRGDPYLEPVSRVKTRLYRCDAWLSLLGDGQAAASVAEARQLARELHVEELEDELLLREGRLLAARRDWEAAASTFEASAAAAGELRRPASERLAAAHARRARARAGGRASDGEAPDGGSHAPPLRALIAYLDADALAAAEPSRAAAEALERAADLAVALEEPCLLRAALQRAACVWIDLGEEEPAASARDRARAALLQVLQNVPNEARDAFTAHPHNAILLEGGASERPAARETTAS